MILTAGSNAVHARIDIKLGLCMVQLTQPKPTSVSNLLGSWLRNFSSALRQLILVGASAMCWALFMVE